MTRFRLLAALLVLSGVALLALAGLRGLRRWLRPPNLVVIVADTLRADRLGAYGSTRGLTPFLDALAARGTVFRNAYATSSWTCPSVASLFTSRYPSQHHVTDFDARLPADEVTLAERLNERRYLSAGFSANFRLSETLGYGQGFVGFFAIASQRKVTADRLGRKSALWLDQAWNRNARRPLFLYYQLMETHAPYDPGQEPRGHGGAEAALLQRLGVTPETAARATAVNERLTTLHWADLAPADVSLLASLYDAEAAALDARLARLFDQLARRGVLDRALIVFTADHGEEFRDHGQLLHGTSLFNELIRVPLIVVGPGWPAGRVVEENVSLVDVAPTVLALLELPSEPRFEGRSLVPLRDGARGSADVLAELPPPIRSLDLGRHQLAFVRGAVKLVVPRGEGWPVLYDLATDPQEKSPTPPRLAAERSAYKEEAERLVAALGARAGTPERAAVDERTRARLRALGYAN